MDILFELDDKTKIISVPRRIYFSFPFNRRVKDDLKGMGANWDPKKKMWWMGKGNKNVEKAMTYFQDKMEAMYGSSSKNFPVVLFEEGKDIQLTEQKRRYEFRFPYNKDLKDKLKSYGARWDGRNKIWYMAKGETYLEEAFELFKEYADRLVEKKKEKEAYKQELKRRRQEGLGANIPYEHNDIAKNYDAIFNRRYKTWYFPSPDAKQEALEELQDRLAEERRKKQEREMGQILKKVENRLDRDVSVSDIEKVTFSGRSRRDTPNLGHVYRRRKDGQTVEIVHVGRPEKITEGRSFGYNFDEGWLWTAYVVPASQDDQDRLESEDKAKKDLRDAIKDSDQLAKKIREEGEYPDGPVKLDTMPKLSIRDRDSILYGGGSWFHIEPGAWIWFVQNNGADGDNWSRNNTKSGGEIAYRLPFDQDIADRIKENHQVLSGGSRTASIAKKVADKFHKKTAMEKDHEKQNQRSFTGKIPYLSGVGSYRRNLQRLRFPPIPKYH